MVNVLMLHESEQATLMLTYLSWKKSEAKYGDMRVEKQLSEKVTREEIAWADVILCVRGESPMTEAILRYARQQGKFLLYLLDDDLKDLPKGSFRFPGRKKWLLRCISLCHMLLTPNQLIAEEYAEFIEGGRTMVGHTSVTEEEISTTVAEPGVVKLVYAASRGHIPNFNAFIKPILPRLFEKYGKGIELHLIGLDPQVDVGEFNSQIHFVPGMPLEAYNEFMKTHHYDIGLSPLVTNHFTERKYFNKYIEYAKVGICGVYSRVMPYMLAVKDGWNGFCADNDPESWYETLCRVIEDHEGRARVVVTAQEHLRTEHGEEHLRRQMMGCIPELEADYSGSDRSVPKAWPGYVAAYRLRHSIFRCAERIYLTVYSLKRFGFASTIARIKSKIRK